MNGKELLIDGIEKIGLEISEEQANQFMKYYEMLIETNKVMNLTAITELDEVIIKHFIDSLLVAKKINVNNFDSLIDVGTGAGFPGIPIKIMFPKIRVVLLDSLNKRLIFLQEVVKELNLKNIEIVHARAEEFGQNKNYREKFDIATSRAVANLATLSEYLVPLVKISGKIISMKASNAKEEINDAQKAIEVLGGKIEKIEEFDLPESDIGRTIIIIDKNKCTPAIYPRKAGTPAKEPIK